MATEEEKKNRIKVVGYAQRPTVYNEGIEYRNFSDNLVGNQFSSDDDTALFTSSNFRVGTNLDPKATRSFYNGKYSNFYNLDNLNVTEEFIKLIGENSKVKLNLDKTNLRNYAYYGSLVEYVRVTLEGIILNWPASIYLSTLTPNTNDAGDTLSDYTYDSLTRTTTFKVPTSKIRNKFDINYLTNGVILDSFTNTNELRNLTVNYLNYVLTINNVDYNIIDFVGADTSESEFITIKVNGNPIGGGATNVDYHIRPNKYQREAFFNSLGDLESHLLNRFKVPQYTADFRYPIRTDSGIVMYKTDNVIWPTNDGYNIDFDSNEYTLYVSKLIDIAQNNDNNLSDYMVRFLVAEAISDFDTVQKCDNSLEETQGQKINKTLRIYGREFDEVKRKIDGLQYANTVSYDKKNNTPDVILKNVARTLGWELTNSMVGNDLIQSYLDIQESSFAGHSRGLTPIEVEHELWRRLILNSAWLWKSKGTRKSIEFLFRFIGAPEGLMTLNEYMYVADDKIDTDVFISVLEKNKLSTDLDLYNVDDEGYPKAFRNTSDMYYQKGGGWYRETGGSGATQYILHGNNPHVGPYDGGKTWKNQFETLIPNFSAVTITEETITNSSTNIFTNYNSGFFNNLVDETIYTSISPSSVVNPIGTTFSIIDDPMPSTETTDCGCETGIEDKSLFLDFKLFDNNVFTTLLLPKLNNGAFFNVEDDEECTLDIKFDYLFKFDCEEIIRDITENFAYPNISTMIENFKVVWNLEVYGSGITGEEGELEKIITKDLFNVTDFIEYVRDNENTGIYLSGNSCDVVNERLKQEFGSDCDIISDTTLKSDWLTIEESITDVVDIERIKNKRIVVSLTYLNQLTNHGILIDRIELNKNCTETERVDSTITTSPGFSLYKAVDNKKSWVTQDTVDTREHDLKLRDTSYLIKDNKLGVNTKELDLHFDYAKPLECDLFSYYQQCEFEHIICAETLFSCPSGFELTPANDNCVRTTTISATPETTTYTVGVGAQASSHSGLGARFYGNLSGLTMPIQNNNAGGINNLTLVDGSGDLNPYPDDYFNISGVPLTIDLSVTKTQVPNSIWEQDSGPFGNGQLGRLRTAGVWSDPLGGGIPPILTPTVPNGDWIGFTACVDIPVGGTFWVGIGADNFCRFRLNGEPILIIDDDINFLDGAFAIWHMFQLDLKSGKNIIEMEGSENGGSTTSFAAEIYSADTATLTGATTEGELGLVFTTRDLIGETFDIGTDANNVPNSGFGCPAGFALDTCDGTTTCTQFEFADVILDDSNQCSICVEPSEPTPNDTNIYVFYDGTSLDANSASESSASINEWYNTFKADNPDYVGKLYEMGVGGTAGGISSGENWLGWATYPYYGQISGFTGNMSGTALSTSIGYNTSWCTGLSSGGFCAAHQPHLNDGPVFPHLDYTKTLPPGAISNNNGINSGHATWSGGDENVIVIMIVDESDIPSKCYYELAGDANAAFTPDFTNQPTHRWEAEYEMFLDVYKQYNFFRGFVFPTPQNRTSGASNWCQMLLHVAGAMEGELVPPTATDRIPQNDICDKWIYDEVTRSAPYSAMTQTSEYQSLQSSLQNGAGLKNFGWGTDYNITSYTPEQFDLSLNNFLQSSDLQQAVAGQEFDVNPADFLSIDPTDTSITYEDKIKAYSTELIDVKTRKVLQSYPLTRKIYDDYLDGELGCGPRTPVQYKDSIKFGKLVDNFWVDLVEQVIPSTAMWDSTYVYRNSMFDASKTQYKKYTLFNGDNLGALPFDTIAVSENVELLTYDITNLEETPECAQVVIGSGDIRNVAIAQMDCGSEFYGSITIIGGGGNTLLAP